MNAFEEVPLPWEGKRHVIKPERVLKAVRLLEYMEPPLMLHHFLRFVQEKRFPLATMAEAYAVLLRFAGAEVKDEQVVYAMQADTEVMQHALEAVEKLFAMMLPPAEVQASGKGAAAGEPTGGSSPSSSSSSSARAG